MKVYNKLINVSLVEPESDNLYIGDIVVKNKYRYNLFRKFNEMPLS